MAKNKRRRYTAAERRAYWIGVGMSVGSAVAPKATRWAYDDYYCNLSDAEHESLQAGLRRLDAKDHIVKKPKR